MEKLQQAYPPFQSSFLIHIHCLPAQMPVSLAGNVLDVCCAPSRGWEPFLFRTWLLSPTIDKAKARGSRSSCFCPFYQLKCSSITSNCRHLTEARLGTQKYLRSICCLVDAGLVSILSNTLKSRMLLELQIRGECLP